MGCSHVMSSERISYNAIQTLHLLSKQAFAIYAVLPHLVLLELGRSAELVSSGRHHDTSPRRRSNVVGRSQCGRS